MKKNIGVLCIFAVCTVFFTGCMSFNVKKKEIIYTEMDSSECNSNAAFQKKAAIGIKGLKITNTPISKVAGDNNIYLINHIELDATEFIKNNPDFDMRVEKDRTYTVYLSVKKEVFLIFVTYIPILEKVKGLRTLDEIEAEKEELRRLQAEKEAAEEKARIEKEEAEKKAETEKQAKLNAAGKSLAKGYIYHGIEEVDKNRKLFRNGALESGHAYYISGFVVKYGGTMAKIEYGDGFFFSSQSSAVYVDYISQKVKGEVVEAGVTNFFGQTVETPITVVVAGGKGITKIPVVLGVIED